MPGSIRINPDRDGWILGKSGRRTEQRGRTQTPEVADNDKADSYEGRIPGIHCIPLMNWPIEYDMGPGGLGGIYWDLRW
jgi:hypothetical protein